jgi:hypothetical protein
MKMDADISPGMLATLYQTTKCSILEHNNPSRHSCKNLRPHKEMLVNFFHYEVAMHHEHTPQDQAFLLT